MNKVKIIYTKKNLFSNLQHLKINPYDSELSDQPFSKNLGDIGAGIN